jgi:hypothetical protein
MRLCLASLMLLAAPLLWGASGPGDRPITDPQSVVSASNPAARPVPIDDLYYTRSVFDPAWSPDGRQVVEAHYYANEGHGFDKRENQIDAIRRTVEWFDRYLKARN